MPKLIAAVQAGDIDQVKKIVEELESLQVSIDEKDRSGMTALMWACVAGRVDIADYLLQHKASVNIQADSVIDFTLIAGGGKTALMFACSIGSIELVNLLLSYKADASISNAAGLSALTTAADNGKLEVVKLLVELSPSIDVSIKSYALYRASIVDHLEVMQYLHEQGAEVNAVYGMESALLSAAKCGSLDLVKLLLGMGGKVRAMYNFRPLLVALQNGHEEVVHFLLEYGASVHDRDNAGRGALMFAVQGGNIELVKLVINQECEINLVDRYGNSPLMLAVAKDQIEIAKLLMGCGASMRNVDIVMEHNKLSAKMLKLVDVAFEIDDILDDGHLNDGKFYPEYAEVVVNMVIYRLTKATMNSNIAALEEYLTKYLAHIAPESFAQIQEAIIVYKLAEALYKGGSAPESLPILSDEMIKKICKCFDMRIEMNSWEKQKFALMREGVSREGWPDVLAQKIMAIIAVRDVADSETDDEDWPGYTGAMVSAITSLHSTSEELNKLSSESEDMDLVGEVDSPV